MPKTYHALSTTQLSAKATFVHPPEPPVIAHLGDSAMDVMVDFKHMNAFTIKPTAPISEARMEMKVSNTHLLLVTDNSDVVIGMITSEDILGEKPLKVAQQRYIQRSEVLVRMVMTQQTNIPVIDITELKHAKVGDIVETLHYLKQHYALVVETDLDTETQQRVRGMYSLSQISKQLGVDVTFDLSEAHSILELQKLEKDS